MKSTHTLLFSLLLIAGIFCASCSQDGQAESATNAPTTTNDSHSDPGDGDISSESDVSVPDSEPEEEGDFITITGDNVNVRQKPNRSAKVVFQAEKGQKLHSLGSSAFAETIGERTDLWQQVELDGKTGWAFGAFTDRTLSEHSRMDTMEFQYADMGDYFHLGFAWAGKGNPNGHGWKCERYGMEADGTWDFGYGYQFCELSGYELDLGEGITNPDYMGKKFEVEWKSLMSTPWEGEGSMETVKMEIPIIVGLKLLDK